MLVFGLNFGNGLVTLIAENGTSFPVYVLSADKTAIVDSILIAAFNGNTPPAGYANAVIIYLPRKLRVPPGAQLVTLGSTTKFQACFCTLQTAMMTPS